MNQFLKWAAEMDRAASVAEAESDGSPQFLAIIDGNRAIAEVLRQGAALEAAIAHAAAQFDEADAKRADDAPCSADSHFREAVRTIARTLPPSTAKVDRAAIWGELREMDRLHVDNAKLAADLAAAEAAINALDCHYGATEELGHDCKDASPCMREVLESERDTALADLAATKAKMAAAEIERDSWKRAHAECSGRLGTASAERDSWQHMAKSRGQDLTNQIGKLRAELAAMRADRDGLHARLALIANAIAQHDRCEDDDLPAKACSFLSEARQAARPFLAEGITEAVGAMRAQVWREMAGGESRG